MGNRPCRTCGRFVSTNREDGCACHLLQPGQCRISRKTRIHHGTCRASCQPTSTQRRARAMVHHWRARMGASPSPVRVAKRIVVRCPSWTVHTARQTVSPALVRRTSIGILVPCCSKLLPPLSLNLISTTSDVFVHMCQAHRFPPSQMRVRDLGGAQDGAVVQFSFVPNASETTRAPEIIAMMATNRIEPSLALTSAPS
jgi:hypothetical protein